VAGAPRRPSCSGAPHPGTPRQPSCSGYRVPVPRGRSPGRIGLPPGPLPVVQGRRDAFDPPPSDRPGALPRQRSRRAGRLVAHAVHLPRGAGALPPKRCALPPACRLGRSACRGRSTVASRSATAALVDRPRWDRIFRGRATPRGRPQRGSGIGARDRRASAPRPAGRTRPTSWCSPWRARCSRAGCSR
jgi:hypothetical protein